MPKKVTRLIECIPIDSLEPYALNARTHSLDQLKWLVKKMLTVGWTNPVLTSGLRVVAGHGRIAAARMIYAQGGTITFPDGSPIPAGTVPRLDCSGWDETTIRAEILADNQSALQAGWDFGILRDELAALDTGAFDMSLTGFDEKEREQIATWTQEEPPTDGKTDPDDVPEPPKVPVSVKGDVWILGKHRVMCGDSTVITDVERLMDGKKAALMHADPPYGMGKEKDGVQNDNLYSEKLDAFQMAWWAAFRKYLEDNASAYIWGNAEDLWRLWYRAGFCKTERMTFRNEIVWDKKSGQGMNSESHRMYPTASERCLFFMLGEQGFNNNADNYWDGWEPIRAYIEEQMKKCKWSVDDMNRITGNSSMARHWVSKSQFVFITPENYKKLQEKAREHDAFKREHDELKRDFYETRAYFDNTHDKMTDVWDFPRVVGKDRHDHATPKPVAMMERAITSALPKDKLCIEPFGGSGSTLIACEKTGRVCRMMELDPLYVDVIVKRWQEFTGKQATHEETGKKFDDCKPKKAK